MVLAVNFHNHPATVTETGQLEEVLTVGAVTIDDDSLQLGPHSALVAVRG